MCEFSKHLKQNHDQGDRSRHDQQKPLFLYKGNNFVRGGFHKN